MRSPRFSLRRLLIALPFVAAVLGFGANYVYYSLTEFRYPPEIQAKRDAIAKDIEPRLRADGFPSPRVVMHGARNKLTGQAGYSIGVVTEGVHPMPGSLSAETARALCQYDFDSIVVANDLSPEAQQALETRYTLLHKGELGSFWGIPD
jgi:hypothetical protein